MKRLLIAIMLLCAVNADASVVCRGRGFAAAVAATYSTWTNTYMSYRSLWQNYQSNSVTIAYDHNPGFPVDATNQPAASEPTATIVGTNALGVIDYAYLFDGLNDYQIMSESRGLSPGLDDFTCSAWAKMVSASVNYEVIFGDLGTSGTARWALGLTQTNSQMYFSVTDTGGDYATAYSSQGIPTNEWVHLMGVRKDVTNVYLYTNGVLAGASSNSALDSCYTFPNPHPSIGAVLNVATGGLFFNGYIDNAYFYARAFTADDATNEAWNTDHRGVNVAGNVESTNRNWSDITVPVGGYNMRGDITGLITDYTGHSNGATNNGGNATQEEAGTNEHGVINYAIRLNAADEYMDCASLIDDISSASDLTICFWINQNSLTGYNNILGISDGSDATDHLHLYANGSGTPADYGRVSFSLYSTTAKIAWRTTAPILTSNTWAFIALRFGTGGNYVTVNDKYPALTYARGNYAVTNTLTGITGMDVVRVGGIRISNTDYNTADCAMTDILFFTNFLSNLELQLIAQWTKPDNNLKVY